MLLLNKRFLRLLLMAAMIGPAGAVHGQLTVLETDFGPATVFGFEDELFLDYSTRPSEAEAKQFFIDSGLDAEMSNGQMISDVATEQKGSTPYYNPFGAHTAFSGGSFTFGPAAGPLEIDTAALSSAVMANAADIDILRFELLQELDGNVEVVVSGEKEDFNFVAVDFGSGVSFGLRWEGIGHTLDTWHDDNAVYAMRISVGSEPTIGACCINGGCLELTESECDSVQGTFQGAGTTCTGTVILETDFGSATVFPFDDMFYLDYTTRPSESAAKQFFIDTGLDAQMSNGQMISDVATENESSTPYYNPFGTHSAFSGGMFVFGPAAAPLEIDTAALTSAVMANAADIDILRFELLQQLDGNVEVVASGEKEDFNFVAVDWGSGVSFGLRWEGIGYDADNWHDENAEYAMRISVGSGQPVDCPASCDADLNDDGVVNVSDMLQLLGAWGACP